MKAIEIIKQELKKVAKPKKILLSFGIWQRLVQEENLIGKFCTNCREFLKLDQLHCKKCTTKEKIISKELTIITILDLPFEVTDRVKKDEVTVI